MAAPTEDTNEPKSAPALVDTAASKKKSKKSKKAFVPLPVLEQVHSNLPWQIAFSQKLGRHAIASRDIEAGEQVLAEEAVVAVPAQMHQEDSCHTCLQELPTDGTSQASEQPILDATSGGYKRYCSQRCHDRDTLALLTAPVHAVIPDLAEDTACDPTLLRVILELDSRWQTTDAEAKHDHTEETADSDAEAMSTLRLANNSEAAAPSAAAPSDQLAGAKASEGKADAAVLNGSTAGAVDEDQALSVAANKNQAGAPLADEDQALPAAADRDQAGAAAAAKDEGISASPLVANGAKASTASADDGNSVLTSSIKDVQALLGPWDRNEASWRQAIAAGCQALQGAIAKSGTYEPGSMQQLQFLAACVNANAHATGHQEASNSTTALGMYPVLSMFNHSCKPNLAQSSLGRVQQVHATRAIKKGQQLCVHYTELFEPRRVRQQALLQEKFFSCACDRCTVPIEQSPDRFLEGIQCGKGQCREVLLSDKPAGSPDEVFKCVGCGRATPGRAVDGTGPRDVEQQATRLWNHALQTLQQQGNDAARSLFQQLQDQYQGPGKLHPLHVRIMDTHMPLVNSCRRMGDIQSAVRNLTQLISAMEYHHASPFLETMNLYQHLAQLYIDLASSAQPNKKLVARAQKLARDTHRKYVGLRKICQGQDVAASDAVFMHDLDKATVLR